MREGAEKNEERERTKRGEGEAEGREKARELSSHPVVHTNMTCGGNSKVRNLMI